VSPFKVCGVMAASWGGPTGHIAGSFDLRLI